MDSSALIGCVGGDGIRSAEPVSSSSSASVAASFGGFLAVAERLSGSCGGEGEISGCDLDVRPVSFRSYVDREVEKASSKAAFQT